MLDNVVDYVRQYGPGPCGASDFPNANTSTTPVQYITDGSTSGSTMPVSIGGLEPLVEYCASLCLEDITAGSGYICTTPTSFKTVNPPTAVTEPATDVGGF